MANDMGESGDGQQAVPSWMQHVTWLLLIAFGWLVFHLTAQPGLAAVIICAKFGWEDAVVARWLSRADPDRQRGLTYSWAYLSCSFWKTAITATFLMVGFVVVNAVVAVFGLNQNPGNQQELLAVLLTATVAFALAVLVSGYTLYRCWRLGLRLWMDQGIYHARREKVWPPVWSGVNRGRRLLTVSLALSYLLAMWSALLLAAMAIHHVPPGGPRHFDDILAAVLLGLGIAGLIAMPLLRVALEWRFIARGPEESWPLENEGNRDGS